MCVGGLKMGKLHRVLATDIYNKKYSNSIADIRKLKSYIDRKEFDWKQRYDKRYVLKFARDYRFSSSRLQKAVEVIDIKERIKINKGNGLND